MTFITTSKAAGICGVARTTISKWIDEGMLKAFVTPGGHRKIIRQDLIDFLEKNSPQTILKFREKKRILIVDDNPDDIKLLEAVFLPSSDKYEIHAANSGFQAIYKIGEIKPHIVILDIVMPDMDGFKVCERIKNNQETKNIKVIVVTAYPDKIKEKEAHQCGFDAFFTKPIDLKKLVKTILEFSQVGNWSSSRIVDYSTISKGEI
ncbi:MAG: response regulator [Desulfobacterales bacterium]|nr:response regulator [Desulfobacterales bacterium]